MNGNFELVNFSHIRAASFTIKAAALSFSWLVWTFNTCLSTEKFETGTEGDLIKWNTGDLEIDN